jgi:putative intracellular protease/amidase
MSKTILFVLTSHDRLGETSRKTGFQLEEVAIPYYALKDHGARIAFASIRGGAARNGIASGDTPPNQRQDEVGRFLRDPDVERLLATTTPIAAVEEAGLDAVFLPGGHGVMWDFPGDAALARMVGALFDAGKPVAAVCHGPAGLVDARRADGRPIVEGRNVASFANSEEAAIGMTEVVPFLLEDRLKALGGRYSQGPTFTPYAVRDGNLITGQNPMSSALVADHLIAALGLGPRSEAT